MVVTIQRVGDNAWACIGGGADVFHSYGANQGFVVENDTGLVVDSGFHYRTARLILGRLTKPQLRRLLLVDTHYHSDHVFGNKMFSERGAAILSHEKCRRAMLAQSTELLRKYRARDPRLEKLLAKVEISYPSVTFRDRVTVYPDDGLKVEVFHPGGRAHTDGDSIVHVHDDRVVFAGDVLWNGYHPNLEDADVRGQVRALKMILKLRPRKVVPGHGPVCGLREVRRFIRYLEELESRTKRAVREGVTGERLLQQAIPPWSRGWKMKGLAESYVHGQAELGK